MSLRQQEGKGGCRCWDSGWKWTSGAGRGGYIGIQVGQDIGVQVAEDVGVQGSGRG